jgi:hypothetical protein
MFKRIRMALIPAGVLIAMLTGPTGNAEGDAGRAGGPRIEGVWTCTVIRAGTIERPGLVTFKPDGTFDYSSAATINSIAASPVQNSGFHSRGGGRGEWQWIGDNVISYKGVELLYDANGNAGGSFVVNSTQLLTSGDQLCSGRAECPHQVTSVSLAKFVFDQNDPDGDIVGVSFLLPPDTPVQSLCNRLSSGQGFPGMPIPVP